MTTRRDTRVNVNVDVVIGDILSDDIDVFVISVVVGAVARSNNVRMSKKAKKEIR